MTSSVPADAASVWRLRTELKPHYQDGLRASADSDFYVLLVSFRALLNRAGLTAHFTSPGDVADLELKANPFTRAGGQAQHFARWTQDRVHLEALLLGVLKEGEQPLRPLRHGLRLRPALLLRRPQGRHRQARLLRVPATPRLQRRVTPSQCCLRSVDVAITVNITAEDELGVGYLGSVWAGVDGQLRP